MKVAEITSLTLGEIQRYVADMEKSRGCSGSSILEQTLKLAEETGEVCKAVRKHTALSVDPRSAAGTIGEELADVLIYLAAIANRANIDLEDALFPARSAEVAELLVTLLNNTNSDISRQALSTIDEITGDPELNAADAARRIRAKTTDDGQTSTP